MVASMEERKVEKWVGAMAALKVGMLGVERVASMAALRAV